VEALADTQTFGGEEERWESWLNFGQKRKAFIQRSEAYSIEVPSRRLCPLELLELHIGPICADYVVEVKSISCGRNRAERGSN